MRRLSTVVMAAVVAVGIAGGFTSPAGAAADPTTTVAPSSAGIDAPTLHVVKVSGLLDPILADFLARSVRDANASGSLGVLLQINSSGSVISDERLVEVARTVHESEIPVVAWVGPSGARARGAMAQLVATADWVGIAPGSRIGDLGEVVVPTEWWAPAFVEHRDRLTATSLSADQAKDLGVAPDEAAVLRQALLQVPGFQVETTTTDTGQELVATQLLFSQLPTGASWMHTVASPAVAYLLFVIGMALIIFELFTAGVGIAGLVGAGSFVLGSYGLWVLPVRAWALALLVLAMVAYVVDIQVGVPRAWTAIATVLFVAGTVGLYDGVSAPWLSLVGGVVGMVVFMVYAMPAMTRTRFSTPSIPRDWLVGSTGEVVDDLGPSGSVRIEGAVWPSRTTTDAAVGAGAAVEVTGVDGVVLEVRPAT